MKSLYNRILSVILVSCICLILTLPAADAAGVSIGNANLIELTGSGASFSCSGVSAEDSTITISKAGSYILRGTLENGRIIIDTGLSQEKLNLTLDGVSITCLLRY